MLKLFTAATSSLLVAAAASIVFAATPAAAKLSQAAMATGPQIIRGKVISYEGQTLVMKNRSTGKPVTVMLAPDTQAATVTVIPIEAIKQGSYIGTAAEPGRNGVLTALEVHVFPEAMRGTGDGHRPWNLSKKSSMTNGNVATVAESGKASAKAKGRMLTVDYKGGTQQVFVPPSVPIVAFAPAQLSQLAPGVPVFVIGTATPDGKVAANRITLGTNGVAPPM